MVEWGKCEYGWNWETQPLQQKRTTEVISLKTLRTAASQSSPLSLWIPVPGYLRGALLSFSGLAVGRQIPRQPAPEITGLP